MNFFVKIIVWLIRNTWFRTYFRIKMTGLENIPKEGGFILCANHKSYWDAVALMVSFPKEIRFMGKESLFKKPVLGSILRGAGAFPVKRDTGDLAAVKKALTLLKEGECVGIFPEATRVRKDIQVDSVKAGAVMFALKAKVPIVPAGLETDYKAFSTIRINIGAPVVLDEYYGKKLSGEEMGEIANNMFKNVKELAKGE